MRHTLNKTLVVEIELNQSELKDLSNGSKISLDLCEEETDELREQLLECSFLEITFQLNALDRP